ncbi:MAG: porin [SAR86 cluster bacterium]|nr:porin [SAR86 cluster bacterium]
MNIKCLVFFVTIVSSVSIFAEPVVYGKIWITAESQDREASRESDLVSNASRLGIKGEARIGDGLLGIYQLEYEVDPVDGTADETKNRTLKQRNSFIGIKGSKGTLFLGIHDTAFKGSQFKIDLFNDLAADRKNILHGKNRMRDFLGYTSPGASGFTFTINAIRGNDGQGDEKIGDSKSYSLNYENQNIYVSLAQDSKIKGYDNSSISVQIPIKRHGIGFIYQESKNIYTGISQEGHIISLAYTLGEKGRLEMQSGSSDMKIEGGQQTTLGYKYYLSKEFQIFFFITDLKAKDVTKQKTINALGFQWNF